MSAIASSFHSSQTLLSPLSERGAGGFVSLNIYDILGREVESLVNEELKAGSYKVNFNADRLSSGVYYYKLATGDFSKTKRMVVVK
jgi:hypothetical protein